MGGKQKEEGGEDRNPDPRGSEKSQSKKRFQKMSELQDKQGSSGISRKKQTTEKGEEKDRNGERIKRPGREVTMITGIKGSILVGGGSNHGRTDRAECHEQITSLAKKTPVVLPKETVEGKRDQRRPEEVKRRRKEFSIENT